MQCDNLNKGRVTGPCVTVDAVEADEGAMSEAEVAGTCCASGDGPWTVQWQSKHRAIIYAIAPSMRCETREDDGDVFFSRGECNSLSLKVGPPSP